MPATQQPAGSVQDRREAALHAVLLLVALAWTVLWFLHALPYWEDDAYIHLEFARSVSRGAGFAFNGHVVYGDTSPLWVWLLAGVHAVVPGWMAAGKTLAVLGAVWALGGVYALARRLVPGFGKGAAQVFAAAMVLLLVTNPYFGYWAFSGMEALAAAGLVCWALVLVGCERLTAPLAPPRFLLGCLCAGLAPLLRPEMAFFTLLLALVLLARWINMPVAGKRAKVGLFFGGFALVAVPGVLWALYALHTFGSVLPNTDAAKRAGPADSVTGHLLGIYSFGFPLVVAGLGLLAADLLVHRGRDRREAIERALPAGGWLLFVWTALNALFYVANHTYVQTRYIFVTAPVLTIALMALARKLAPRVYAAGLAVGLVLGVAISLLTTWPLIRNKIGVDRVYAELAAELRTLPPGAPVAHYSIGEAAFLSQHPIIDTGGITRPGVIPFLWDPTPNRLIYWAHAQGARYMVVGHAPEPGSVLVWQHPVPVTGWYLRPRRYREQEDLQLWRLPQAPTLPLPPDMPLDDGEPMGLANH